MLEIRMLRLLKGRRFYFKQALCLNTNCKETLKIFMYVVKYSGLNGISGQFISGRSSALRGIDLAHG